MKSDDAPDVLWRVVCRIDRVSHVRWCTSQLSADDYLRHLEKRGLQVLCVDRYHKANDNDARVDES